MADGLGRGRAAIDIELGLVAAVRAQMRGQHAAVGRCRPAAAAPPASPRRRRRRTARRWCGRSSRGCARRFRRRSPARACRRRCAAAPSAIGERIDEARADRLQVEGGAAGDAEPGLHRDRGRREGLVGRRGRRARSGRSTAARAWALASAARAALSARSEVNSPGAAIWRSRMPVRCTIHSSVVSTERARSSLVRMRLGQIAAAAEHDRTHHRHEAAPLASRAVGLACGRARPDSPILASSS